MKKTLIAFCLLLSAATTALAQSTARLDSTVAYDYSYGGNPKITVTHYSYDKGELDESYSETYFQDTPGERTLTEKYEYFTGTVDRGYARFYWDSDRQTWIFDEGIYYEVDEYDLETVVATQNIVATEDGTDYYFTSREEKEFNENGNVTSWAFFNNVGAPTFQNWSCTHLYEYTYYANGQTHMITEYRPDEETGQLVVYGYYEYDANGNTLNSLTRNNFTQPNYWEKYETVIDEDNLTSTFSYSTRQLDEYDFKTQYSTQTVYGDSIGGKVIERRSYNADGTLTATAKFNYIYMTITIDDETAINQVAADGQAINVVGHKIITRGASRVTVHDINGQLISTSAVTEVKPGFYIVRADGKTIKVMVK